MPVHWPILYTIQNQGLNPDQAAERPVPDTTRVSPPKRDRQRTDLRNRAAAQIYAARVDGAAIGSRDIAFHPGEVQSGHYDVTVGYRWQYDPGVADHIARTHQV